MDYETMENHIIHNNFESFSRDFRPNDALIVDSEGNNLLHSCGRFGVKDMRILETLLRHIDPNLSDNDGLTPLIYASKKVDPNLANNNGFTPLLYASSNGKEEVVKILLNNPKVDPNLANNDGWTPLIYASYNGEEEVVKILLNNPKVDPNLANNNGFTPLLYASSNGKEEVVKILKLSRYFSTIQR
eukprot:TRINITY_DN1056_c1_g1_i6.p1 TRINITY_DN1056_c1_g1~~TRINITY_DN1056_c1_g1_i6.p1  ORF type:complete len:187 (+),score=63.02 TRINITY_DN1056_c1_g1_i6:120-680(+)